MPLLNNGSDLGGDWVVVRVGDWFVHRVVLLYFFDGLDLCIVSWPYDGCHSTTKGVLVSLSVRLLDTA